MTGLPVLPTGRPTSGDTLCSRGKVYILGAVRSRLFVFQVLFVRSRWFGGPTGLES